MILFGEITAIGSSFWVEQVQTQKKIKIQSLMIIRFGRILRSSKKFVTARLLSLQDELTGRRGTFTTHMIRMVFQKLGQVDQKETTMR